MARIRKGAPAMKAVRRILRSSLGSPELIFWSRIRMKQLGGLKFRRQHGIGPYIVDFYCPDRKLVVELDGETHFTDSQSLKDKQRDLYLRSLGVQVVRYTNDDVLSNLTGVLEDLEAKVVNSTSPGPSLQRRGKAG